jgi:hypothetical protein
MGDSRIKDISSLLSSFFNADKLRQGEKYSEFFTSWTELVGERLAAHSHVADIDKGLLVIEAEHPGWIQLLQIRQSGILAEVARRYPELALRGIVFRLSGQGGTWAERVSSADKPILEQGSVVEAEPNDSDESEALSAKSTADDIKDPEFRALFSSLRKAMQRK